MSKFWKIALAVGGFVVLWTLTRGGSGSSDEGSGGSDAPPRKPEGGPRPSSGGSGSGAESASPGSAPPSGGAAAAGDGGVVRDGRMRSGTWNFAPSDAAAGAPGCLVLRDVPKNSITVDGRVVELRGGFRGFRDVPAGKHKLELEGFSGIKVASDIEMPAGGCIVLIYEDTGGPPRLEPDRDWGPQYIGLAMGGAMGQALWPWPKDAA